MGTTKRAPKPSSDGDLFPRGRGEGSVARVRKRDGTVLYAGDTPTAAAPPQKRVRAVKSDASTSAAPSRGGLAGKRLAIGMSVLAVVTGVSEKAVEVAIAGGVRGVVDPWEVLVEEDNGARMGKNALDRGREEESDESGSEEDEEDGAPLPLFKVVNVGDVVRVAVVSTEKSASGSVRVSFSCRPSLINVNVGAIGGPVAGGASATALREGELMWGAVKAIEDHGYVISFGGSIPTLGFCSFENVAEGRNFHPGTPVEAAILESARQGKKTRKVVSVTTLPSSVKSARASQVEGMTIAALRAGTRVRAKVTKVEATGSVELLVFGLFAVAVERAHVPPGASLIAGATVDARFLYVDAGSKRIGATLLPELVEERRPRALPKSWSVGRVVSPLVVARVEPGYGVVLEEVGDGGNEGTAPLFAHASRVSDERVDKLESAFHIGLRLDTGARIVSFSPLDGVVNVDLRPSILKRKALSVAEVQPGEPYDCKVVSHSSSGSVIVGVDGDVRIRGVIPASYVSDTAVSAKRLATHSRFKPGSVLRCICLSADIEKGKVVLTSKRSLVDSRYPMLSSYDQAAAALRAAARSGDEQSKPDCLFDGTVAAVTDRLGVLVVFTGGVRGMVAESELGIDAKNGDSTKRSRGQIESLFPVGRTVSVRVLRVDIAASRMTLSADLHATRPDRAPKLALLPAGTFVNGIISSIDEDARVILVHVRREDAGKSGDIENPATSSSVRVSKKGGSALETKKGPIECRLPFGHLSDFPGLSQRFAAQYVKSCGEGSSPPSIEGALVLCDAVGSQTPLITLKTSLIDGFKSGALPKSVDDVYAAYKESAKERNSDGEAGRSGEESDLEDENPGLSGERFVLRGYVKAALPTGVIVGFLGGVVGFARKSRISDDFVADPSKAVSVHESVSAVVDTVDAASGRFTVSLRRSDVGMNPLVADSIDFFSQFKNIEAIFGCPPVENDFPVGAVVDSILDTSRPYGMVLNLKSTAGATAFGVVLEQGQRFEKSQTPSRSVPDPVPKETTDLESESIASAAAATAEAYAAGMATPAAKKRTAAAASARKTRRQQAAEEQAATATTPARVLDVDPFTGVVDVSLDPSVVSSAGKRMMVGKGTDKQVEATILLVKDEYVVLSVPRAKGKTTIAFALLPQMSQHLRLQLKQGIVVSSCVVRSKLERRNLVTVDWVAIASAIATKSTAAKLASVKKASAAKGLGEKKERQNGKKKEKPVAVSAETVDVGSVVSGTVKAVFPMQVNVSISRNLVGRIHISNVAALSREDIDALPLGPVSGTLAETLRLPSSTGQKVKNMSVLGIRSTEDEDLTAGRPKSVELGLRTHPRMNQGTPPSLEVGSKCLGFVKHVKKSEAGHVIGIWVELSPSTAAYCAGIDALDLCRSGSSETKNDSQSPSSEDSLSVGTPVVGMVSSQAQTESRMSVVLSPNGEGSVSPETGTKRRAFEPFWAKVLSVRAGEGLRVELPWLARADDEKQQRWGLVNMCDICDDYDDTVSFCKDIAAGTVVRVRQVRSGSSTSLSMRPSVVDAGSSRNVSDPILDLPLKSSAVGKSVRGFVRSVGKNGCFVSIAGSAVARILLSDLADDFVAKPEESFPSGSLVAGKISFVDPESGRIQLSLRKRKRQALQGDKTDESLGRPGKKIKGAPVLPKEGSLVKGEVSRIERFGALVTLSSSGVTALLHKSEADQDRTVVDPWTEWKVGQELTVVALQAGEDNKCRVGTKRCYFEAAGLGEDETDELLERNARKLTDSHQDDKDSEFVCGDGVLDNQEVSHPPSIPHDRSVSGDSDVHGDGVDGRTNRDCEDSRSSDGEGSGDSDGEGSGDSDGEGSGDSDGESSGDSDGEGSGSFGGEGAVNSSPISDGVGSDCSDTSGDVNGNPSFEDDEKTDKLEGREGSTDVLPIAEGFDFGDGDGLGVIRTSGSAETCDRSEEMSGHGSDDVESASAKVKAGDEKQARKSSREKREKKRAKEVAERGIREREDALASQPDSPETAEDFERLLMGQPNASHIWIRYMAFRASLSQYEKARALAERALETISLSEELERVNIWIAYINLEASYGGGAEGAVTDDIDVLTLRNRAAAVFRVFDRACQRVTDVKDLHLQVAAALRQGHQDIANQVLHRALKTFKHSTDVWCAVGAAHFIGGKPEAGRRTLEKGLLSLNKKEHVSLILKFAQFEYKYGSSERGRTVFSSLCANFPKRLDLWSVFLDMEVARYRRAREEKEDAETEAAVASVRLLFERCISLDFSTKKTKFIFKRWLAFEVETGDKEAQNRVRGKARAYVETKMVPAGK